ncbi:MAG: hypothetical protein Q7P63_00845 [Verrucomicrobiota bacterium JB022]|nr:hypothetical protein [Verrucomicrobiota bacterium JB022]
MARLSRFWIFLALFWAATPTFALVLYGLDDRATASDPGNGVPYAYVARLTDAAGVTTEASAVYLGNRWVLSTRHAGAPAYIQFEVGGPVYPRDLAELVLPLGDSDLILTRLRVDPGLPQLPLVPADARKGIGTLVGWGEGRGSSHLRRKKLVRWGQGGDTTAKRWGLNAFESTLTFTDQHGRTTESFTIIAGNSDAPEGLSPKSFCGDYEAAAVDKDSGSAFFMQAEDGLWYLAGLMLAAERPVTGETVTRFGRDCGQDPQRGYSNVYADLSAYRRQIQAVIDPAAYVMTQKDLPDEGKVVAVEKSAAQGA